MDIEPVPELEQKQVTNTPAETGGDGYDVVIRTNTLAGLIREKEWAVDMRNAGPYQPNSKEMAVYLSVHGREKRGKTFLLSQISGEPFASGVDKRSCTEGISLRFIPSKEDDTNTQACPSVLLLDTAGTDAPFPLKNKLDRIATDCFTRVLVHRVSHINIVVVGLLDLDAQRYLDEIAPKRATENRRQDNLTSGEVVVVHNFSDLEKVEHVKERIERDIIDTFGASVEHGEKWYKSKHLAHYVLAKHGSEAGNHYNQKTIDVLRSKIVHLQAEEVHKVFTKIVNAANQLLPVYFMVEGKEAPLNSATITINATIKEDSEGGFKCEFTGRELRMSEAVQLQFQAAEDYSSAAMKLITEKKLQLSTFLEFGRVSTSFLDNTVLEPKMDINVTDKHVHVRLDAPGCEVEQEVKGVTLQLTGVRRIDNGDGRVALTERPSGQFTITLTFPADWGLRPCQEERYDGVYHLVIAKSPEHSTPVVTRVMAKVPFGRGESLEVTQTEGAGALKVKVPFGGESLEVTRAEGAEALKVKVPCGGEHLEVTRAEGAEALKVKVPCRGEHLEVTRAEGVEALEVKVPFGRGEYLEVTRALKVKVPFGRGEHVEVTRAEGAAEALEVKYPQFSMVKKHPALPNCAVVERPHRPPATPPFSFLFW